MKRHFTAYFEAYLAGSLFLVLQLSLGFVASAKGAPPEIRAHWAAFDWFLFKANIIVFAFPTMIAFLNGSVARGRANAATIKAPSPLPAPKVDPAAPAP